MTHLVSLLSFFAACWSCCFLAASAAEAPLKQTNFIFIMFDDLRPELSIYGRNHMITPNFERLAAKSVVFDQAYAQISVCNPSRDSLLTGLRPDTVGTYAFQSSFRPHMVFPSRFAKAGYNTAGFGKIAHWETPDKDIWNYQQWDNKWYDYQWAEVHKMNASTMPDKIQPEEQFRDYLFTTRFIKTMKELNTKPNYFMLGLGFKLPHLAVHVPWKYYAMYKNDQKRIDGWKLKRKELRYPPTSPAVAYRCCAVPTFYYMENEGAKKSYNSLTLNDINMPFNDRMHDELMLGYAAAITFVDTQLGRILDAMDELSLWHNTTLVLTADHGMHNGEKGIWEKWSMFDESTRVPLLIHHPLSPYHGQHYVHPVELVDIFPTINDLVQAPDVDRKLCVPSPSPVTSYSQGNGYLQNKFKVADPVPAFKKVNAPYMVCHALQGKSLAEVVLGSALWLDHKMTALTNQDDLKNLRKNEKKDNNKKWGKWTGSRRLLSPDDHVGVDTNAAVNTSTSTTTSPPAAAALSPATLSSQQLLVSYKITNPHSTINSSTTTAINLFSTTASSDNSATAANNNQYDIIDTFNTHTFADTATVQRRLSSSSTSTSSRSASLSSPHSLSHSSPTSAINGIILPRQFAISQSWRCSPRQMALDNKNPVGFNVTDGEKLVKRKRQSKWLDCDKTQSPPGELSLMGYSIRTSNYRYTAWFMYNRGTAKPNLELVPFEEEFYDHRNETLADFTHREYTNLVYKKSIQPILRKARDQLISFIKSNMLFRGPFTG